MTDRSSIVYGGTSAFFRKPVRKITSAKITKNTSAILRAKNTNSIFWKFLGNHMTEISWKVHDGNFLETI